MKKWAGALLITESGKVILQKRDDNPGILNSGKITLFGGGVEDWETVEECLKREIKEEVDINIINFEYFGLYEKRQATHGDDCDCYVYLVRDVDMARIKVNEGQGYVLASASDSYLTEEYSLITQSVLKDYFQEPTTVWDNIYQKYKKDGEAYATLQPGLIPEFLDFIQKQDFAVKKVLDIGCGNGKYLAFLKSLGFVTDGIDSSSTAVAMTKETLNDGSNIMLADIYDSELPKEQYDLVISIAAIHHGLKVQVRRAIKQIYPALLSGGSFFVTLPDNEGSTHWTMMADHEEVEPGTRVPLSGPEKGLPHSSFTKKEIQEMFSDFAKIDMQLLADRGRWIITGIK